MDKPLQSTRRAALRHFAGAAAVTALPIFGQEPPPQEHHSVHPAPEDAAPEYRFTFFRPEQRKTLEALTETIIPADAHSRGAKAARVAEYIDLIVADTGDSTKTAWIEGLAAMDRRAHRRFRTSYSKCNPQQQIEVLKHAAANEDNPQTAEERFFIMLKRAAIDGYYTSRIGIHEDLQYQGNAALAEYPSCTHGDAN